jgi:hypothetical protein
MKISITFFVALASSVMAFELAEVNSAATYEENLPTPTFNESAPCWSDQPDPICEPDQWLDRSGLIGVETP